MSKADSRHVFISRPGPRVGNCASCGRYDDEMAMGFCFDCCSEGEERAAKRGVLGHFLRGVSKLPRPWKWWTMEVDFKWAWERLTRTGDYAEGGAFDREGYEWR